ncbi:uncharacterized protein BO97DRAFT_275358 [Aspergillus homomorphus CBS 101889]|uniref:Apple domain-containing protein n=1 Tax=Aspergillus homomorphus (strain CBS 101889) TaxID=1450537 RepID=A0A395I3P7_ASPHC|nr:hypothetical protein BO97DRAFT_275358 [Aspergillus homomorphus CBS 101889]RAL14710.1 hypothetical protein BO97DRAFT_275358 [Aspergillus homomorphus CBS 101889]
MCDGSSISGAVTRAVMSPYARQANINGCQLYCSIFNGMCNAVNYIPASSSCVFLWATGNAVVSASGYQALSSYTTNPCIERVTSIETDYLTQYSTSQVTTVYTVTISTSAAAPTIIPSTPSPAPVPSSAVSPSPNTAATLAPSSAVSASTAISLSSILIPSSSPPSLTRSSGSNPLVSSTPSMKIPPSSSAQQASSSSPVTCSASSLVPQRPSSGLSRPGRVSSSVVAFSPAQSPASTVFSVDSMSPDRPSLPPSVGSGSSSTVVIFPHNPSTVVRGQPSSSIAVIVSSSVTGMFPPHTTEPPVPLDSDDDVVTSTIRSMVTVTVTACD